MAALTLRGLRTTLAGSGAVNGTVFTASLHHIPEPTLEQGDVIVRNHLPAHQVAGLARLVEARGTRLLCLPPD